MDDYLTPEDLVSLTGYKRRADQKRWLTGHGWVFEIARSGRPVVLRSYRDAKMSGSQEQSRPVARHNFDALNRGNNRGAPSRI